MGTCIKVPAGVRTDEEGERDEGKQANTHTVKMAPGKEQKVRKSDAPSAPLLKATQVVWARSSVSRSGTISCKKQPISGRVVRQTSDVWKKEEQKVS